MSAPTLVVLKPMVEVKAVVKVKLIDGSWSEAAKVDAKFHSDATLPQISGQIIKEFWAGIVQLGGIVVESDNLDEPLDFIPVDAIVCIRPSFPKIVGAKHIPNVKLM